MSSKQRNKKLVTDEPTTTMAIRWESKNPTRVTFDAPGRGKLPVKSRKLLAREAEAIKKSLHLSFRNPEIGYYAPCADLTPKPQAKDFHGQPLDWSSEKSVSGEFEVWGPAIPGDNSSLPEPREVLFAGESGFLILRIKNTSNSSVIVTGGTLQSGRSGPAKGRTQVKLSIPPRETVAYTVPIAVAEAAEAVFVPISLRISCSIAGKPVVLSHRTHMAVGRMIKFKQKLIRMKRAGDHKLALSLTAEMPGGICETVDTTMKIGTRVDRNSAVSIVFTPIDFEASVIVSQAFSATAMLPSDLYTSFTFLGSAREIAKGVFQLATAAIMGCLATAGVWVTKILIAAAAQALGPAVGVPVTLVLYSPPVEAWFAKAAIAILGVTGAVLNGDLFDFIFTPTPNPATP